MRYEIDLSNMRKRDYLIVGVVLIIFVGAFYSFYLDNQPSIALGERKSITVGDNIANLGNHVRFEGIISNNTDTFLFFSKYVEDSARAYLYFGLNTIRKIGSFSIIGMEFNVISVDIPKNVTVIVRIK